MSASLDISRRHVLLDDAFDAARHGGFDLEVVRGDDMLTVGCEYPARLDIWIADWSAGRYSLASLDASLLRRLAVEGDVGSLSLDDLRLACGRAYSILRSMPSTPLDQFRERTRTMPTVTEVERLALQRVGQDVFRDALERYWAARCPLTGVAERAMLRASHIRPWSECLEDAERLDVFNGLLLAAHLDAAFDRHLISFTAGGGLVYSPRLSERARQVIAVTLVTDRLPLDARHETFLPEHRERTMSQTRQLMPDPLP